VAQLLFTNCLYKRGAIYIMAYIYKITNDINDKVYVGKTEFSI